MKQLKSLITIQKIAEKLLNIEMGPSDDFVCQYIYSEKNQCPECIMSWHEKLLRENCILMSCSDRVRSRTA